MKIKRYKLFLENQRSKEDINSICQKYNIRNYTINDDGTVDVDGDVDLSGKRLTKLPLKFGRVTGYFNCSENQLTTLEGSPKWVSRYFSCRHNELTTLEGGPEIVIGRYYCYDNKLINFKGFPEDYDGYISIIDNQVDKDGANPVYRLLENIPQEKWNKFIYWCNEFESITDDGKVIPERMEEVYNQIGLEFK